MLGPSISHPVFVLLFVRLNFPQPLTSFYFFLLLFYHQQSQITSDL